MTLPPPTTRTDFRAYTAHGVLIRTFGDRQRAEAWIKSDGDRYPGHRVVEHTETTTIREKVISGRLRLVAS